MNNREEDQENQLTAIVPELPKSSRSHPIIVLDDFLDAVKTNTVQLDSTNVNQEELITDLSGKLTIAKKHVEDLSNINKNILTGTGWQEEVKNMMENLKKNIEANQRIATLLTKNTSTMNVSIKNIQNSVEKVESKKSMWKKQEIQLFKSSILEISLLMGI